MSSRSLSGICAKARTRRSRSKTTHASSAADGAVSATWASVVSSSGYGRHYASLLVTNSIDRASVGDHQQPGAGGTAGGAVPVGASPDREERLLGGLLGNLSATNHAQHKAVDDTTEPLVERAERRLVAPRDLRDQGLIGEVDEAGAHARLPVGGDEGHTHYSLVNANRFAA